MALTRAFLRGLGLEDDKIGAIIEAHAETVDGLKAANKSDAAELQREIDDLKGKLETSGTSAGEWESKYNDLQAEFTNYKDDLQAKATKTAKENAYRALLKSAGVADKRIDTIIKVTDFDSVKLDKDGAIKDADTLTDNIKTEWADFIAIEQTQGAGVADPPAGTGGKMSKAEIMAIKDTTKRQQAIADNIDLFR